MDAYEVEMRQALSAMEDGEVSSAEQHLLEAARLRPQAHEPHFLLGASAAQQGRNDEAEAGFLACLDREPGYAIARFQLGLLKLVNGHVSSSRATLEPLTELKDDHYLLCFANGLLEVMRGDVKRGCAWIEHGIERNQEIAALNGDMRLLLERLRRADAGGGPASESRREDSSHFLLSAYRRPSGLADGA